MPDPADPPVVEQAEQVRPAVYKRPPPEMRKDLSYDDWKSDTKCWRLVCNLPKQTQGIELFLSLKGQAQSCVRAAVSVDDMNMPDGFEKVLAALDARYEKSKGQMAYQTIEDFITFRRPSAMMIEEYLGEFNLRVNKLKTHKMELPPAVLGFYLLNCANLSEEQASLCRATCNELSYDEMKKQIEKVIENSARPSNDSVNADRHTEITPQFMARTQNQAEYHHNQADYYQYRDHDYQNYDNEEVPDAHENEQYTEAAPECSQAESMQPTTDAYYARGGYNRGGRRFNSYQNNRGRGGFHGRGGSNLNPPDASGNPSACSYCKSIYHWVDVCPDAPPAYRGGRGFGRSRGNSHGNAFSRGGQPKSF